VKITYQKYDAAPAGRNNGLPPQHHTQEVL